MNRFYQKKFGLIRRSIIQEAHNNISHITTCLIYFFHSEKLDSFIHHAIIITHQTTTITKDNTSIAVTRILLSHHISLGKAFKGLTLVVLADDHSSDISIQSHIKGTTVFSSIPQHHWDGSQTHLVWVRSAIFQVQQSVQEYDCHVESRTQYCFHVQLLRTGSQHVNHCITVHSLYHSSHTHDEFAILRQGGSQHHHEKTVHVCNEQSSRFGPVHGVVHQTGGSQHQSAHVKNQERQGGVFFDNDWQSTTQHQFSSLYHDEQFQFVGDWDGLLHLQQFFQSDSNQSQQLHQKFIGQASASAHKQEDIFSMVSFPNLPSSQVEEHFSGYNLANSFIFCWITLGLVEL